MVQKINDPMERSSPKKEKNEIPTDRLSTMKRVSDLFPKGFIYDVKSEDLPDNPVELISDSSITKNIPNLAKSSIPPIPQNSIASEIGQRNYKLEELSKQQVQKTLFKRIKPFNIITIFLMLGWVVTIILLNIL